MEAGVPGKTGNVPSLVSESGEAEVLGTTSASNAGGPSSLLSASAISLRQIFENVNPVRNETVTKNDNFPNMSTLPTGVF